MNTPHRIVVNHSLVGGRRAAFAGRQQRQKPRTLSFCAADEFAPRQQEAR